MTLKKKERTPAQVEASRLNGAKSTGPTTPEGQAKSQNNRMVHGFRANLLALANENRGALTDHIESYKLRYSPIDRVEDDLVGLLATNMWQLMRINSVEVALFEIEMSGIDEELDRDYDQIDEYGRLALAFKKSAGENTFELLRRYKSTTERAYHRSLEALEKIRKERQPPPSCQSPETQNNLSPDQPDEPAATTETVEPQPESADPQPIAAIPISTHPDFQSVTPPKTATDDVDRKPKS